MGIKAYSRAERKRQIEQTLAIKVQHGKRPEATMYGIAKSLDMSPSSHLTAILNEMVAEGTLHWYQKVHRPNLLKTVYALPVGSYSTPANPERVIRLTRNGVQMGELLL